MNNIKTTFERYNKSLAGCLPCDGELEPITFSDSFLRRAELIIENTERSVGRKKVRLSRVVCFALIIMALLTTVAFAVGTIIFPNKKIDYKTEKNETTIVFDGEGLEKAEDFDMQYVSVGYLPDGFAIKNRDESDGGVTLYYYNDKDECLRITQQYKKDASIDLDTNGNEIKLVTIDDGRQGLCYTSFGQHTLIFEDAYYYYVIRLPSRMPQTEIVRIANALTLE